MVNLYETKRGDFTPASGLTDEEAVDLFERQLLLASDVASLRPSARVAVLRAIKGFQVESAVRSGTVVVWGLRMGDTRRVIEGGAA
jgi:hypothetical protein